MGKDMSDAKIDRAIERKLDSMKKQLLVLLFF